MIAGSKVVCINDEFPNWAKAMYNALPVKDKIYTVRDVMPGVNPKFVGKNPDGSNVFAGDPEIAITLEEIVNPIDPKSGYEYAYKSDRFAHLSDPIKEKVKIEKREPVLV